MKKLIILFLATLFLTGCYDYQELNKRAIISGIGIDYEQDNFLVTFEILNSNSQGSESGSSTKAYTVEGQAKTIAEAFQDASFKINKESYIAHLKAIVLSEEVAKNHLDKTIDYLIREPNIRNIFYLTVANDCTANKIMTSQSEDIPVISETINNLIEFNETGENISAKVDFEKFLDLLIDEYQDPYLNTISLNDDKLTLDGIGIFKGNKYITRLNNNQTAIANILLNTSKNHYLKIKCPDKEDKYTIINLYNNKNNEFKIKEDKIEIKSDLTASIIEDDCHYNFRDVSVYKELEEKSKEELKKEYIKTITNLQSMQTDILGIEKKFYQEEKKALPNWHTLKIKSDIKIHLNKNGLIFEVKE